MIIIVELLLSLFHYKKKNHNRLLFQVYGVAFSPDRSQLLSCSEDGTIRLWSLQTWSCLVAYKGHMFSVWQVRFANTGYYFASCGHDKTARLWTTVRNAKGFPLLFRNFCNSKTKVKFNQRYTRLIYCPQKFRVLLFIGISIKIHQFKKD